MALTSAAKVRRVPGLNNAVLLPDTFLNDLIADADAAVKTFCKRDLELTGYVEYYSGTNQQDIVLRQFPVFIGVTTVAAGSSGAILPQATLNVTSTEGFSPGTEGGTISVQTSLTTWTTVSYTGVTATTFTGCSGGTGTLSSATGQNGVSQPLVYFDPQGYAGQFPGGFADGTQMIIGSQFYAVQDRGNKSYRGLLRRIGGQGGTGWMGWYTAPMYGGKLSAWRQPVWPFGNGNLKVIYSAGYASDEIPSDLSNAATQLVAYLVRTVPLGAALSSESLGGYSYSVMTQSNEVPEIGSIVRTLSRYREVSW